MTEVYIWLTEYIGLNKNQLRFRKHLESELSHYSSATYDIEFKYDDDQFKELCGIADRDQYDLKQHSINTSLKIKKVPHVIEVSIGLDRLILAILKQSYQNEQEIRGNIHLKLPYRLTPYTATVMPLVKKDGLVEKAKELYKHLMKNSLFIIHYDQTGSIGKLYARQDEIGTPFCLTVDHNTLLEGTITVRDRNTRQQTRVSIDDVINYISNNLI